MTGNERGDGDRDPFDPFEAEDDGDPAPASTLIGGLAQMVAAALVVALVVALLIWGAVVVEWILP
jgi:hypothetical protein